MEDLTIKFSFPKQFDPSEEIVSLVGYAEEDSDETQWTSVPCEVDKDGALDITFTGDTLAKLASGDAVLAVLSEAEAPSVEEEAAE